MSEIYQDNWINIQEAADIWVCNGKEILIRYMIKMDYLDENDVLTAKLSSEMTWSSSSQTF